MSIGNDFGTREHRKRGRGRKAFWIIVSATVLIGVVYTTWSPHHSGFGASRPHSAALEWNVERIMGAIDASEEQRAQLQPALERARSTAQDIARAESDLRAQLLIALQANELDSAEVSRLRASAIELSESAVDSMFESTLEIWSELTSDQRAEALRHWNRLGRG